MTVERFIPHVYAHKMLSENPSQTKCLTTVRPRALVWSQFLVHSVDVLGDVTLLLGLKTTTYVGTRKPLRSLIMDIVDVSLDVTLPIGSITTSFKRTGKTLALLVESIKMLLEAALVARSKTTPIARTRKPLVFLGSSVPSTLLLLRGFLLFVWFLPFLLHSLMYRFLLSFSFSAPLLCVRRTTTSSVSILDFGVTHTFTFVSSFSPASAAATAASTAATALPFHFLGLGIIIRLFRGWPLFLLHLLISSAATIVRIGLNGRGGTETTRR